MSHILIIITAKTCHHCTTFKEKYYNRVIDDAKAINSLNILHIDLPTMTVDFQKEFSNINKGKEKVFLDIKGQVFPINDNIKNMIKWFPQFMLVPMSAWLSGKPFNCSVFNGVLNDGKVTQVEEVVPLNAITIMDWVKQNLNKKPEIIDNTIKNKPRDYMPGYIAPSQIKFKITSRPHE